MAISSVESSEVSLPWGDMEHDRRRTPRYPFDASIEMRVGTSQDNRTARVTGLSLNGCYVNTESPYPEGSSLLVKVFTATEFYEGQATVIYAQEKLGMMTVAWPKKNSVAVKDRKSTRLNSSHLVISYAVFCLKKKK